MVLIGSLWLGLRILILPSSPPVMMKSSLTAKQVQGQGLLLWWWSFSQRWGVQPNVWNINNLWEKLSKISTYLPSKDFSYSKIFLCFCNKNNYILLLIMWIHLNFSSNRHLKPNIAFFTAISLCLSNIK